MTGQDAETTRPRPRPRSRSRARTRGIPLAAALLLPLAPAPLAGADAPEDDRAREEARDLESPGASDTVHPAVRDADARGGALGGVAFPDERPARPTMLREGAFLVRARGILVPATGSRWAFVFDADEEGHAPPPVFLTPCTRLEEMVGVAEASEETATFLVSGRVFAYHGRNHLLPEQFSTVAFEDPAPERDPERATIEANGALSDEPLEEPTLDELLSRLGPRTEGAARRAAETETPAPLREGTVVVSRAGRLVPGPAGLWALAPDNGASPTGGDDEASEALILLPCLAVERMGRIVRERADAARFLVSGEVFAFEGRSYLLPTMFLLDADREGNLTSAR